MANDQVACPKCGREWEAPCEQSVCIEMFGECIPCRFIPIGDINKVGSGLGTDEEVEAIGKVADTIK